MQIKTLKNTARYKGLRMTVREHFLLEKIQANLPFSINYNVPSLSFV